MQRAWLSGAVLAMSLALCAGAAEPTGHEISREQAAQMLHDRYGAQARVVRADVNDQAGQRVYVFRLLSVNGRIWIVRIDARSGAELP
jgi:Peptidase propeptide and YPEB domain